MAYLQTKIPIWVNFGWSCNGRCWYRYFMTMCGYLVYICGHLVGISYSYLVFFPVLACCTKKNLATLALCPSHKSNNFWHCSRMITVFTQRFIFFCKRRKLALGVGKHCNKNTVSDHYFWLKICFFILSKKFLLKRDGPIVISIIFVFVFCNYFSS
jgi:hypothetical protein